MDDNHIIPRFVAKPVMCVGVFSVSSRCLLGVFSVSSRCLLGVFSVSSRCLLGAFSVSSVYWNRFHLYAILWLLQVEMLHGSFIYI